MPATSFIIKNWTGHQGAFDALGKAILEIDSSAKWMILVDLLSATSFQQSFFAFDNKRSLNVVAQAYRNAMQAWAASRPILRTSTISDWRVPKDWRDDLAAEVEAYRLKPVGWDGYSAKTIQPQAIANAVDFIRSLPPNVPRPIDQPYANGDVSLVWRTGDNFAEIVFAGDQTFSWYATNGREEGSGDDLPLDSGLPADLERTMGFASGRLMVTTSSEQSSSEAYLQRERLGSVTTSEQSWPVIDWGLTTGTPVERPELITARIASARYLDHLELTV
jgi:hypothetical protein